MKTKTAAKQTEKAEWQSVLNGSAPWAVVAADCVAAMRAMPEASVGAIVTDPPYGLEFMGREWDRLVLDKPKMTATQAADHMKNGSFGPWSRRKRPINPNTYGHRNEKCLSCGKWRVSSNSCRCPEPKWEYRIRQEAPYSMLAMQRWHSRWAVEAFRIAKPGAHLLAFGGTRTHHRLMCALEDAGWEIRDCLLYLYAQGFPKNLDVSKQLDKAAGMKRKVVGRYQPPGMDTPWNLRNATDKRTVPLSASSRNNLDVTAPATDAAKRWDGWGTGLKPAVEIVTLCRKPLIGTVAQNVLAHGTGVLNIDGCRVVGTPRATGTVNPHAPSGVHGIYGVDSRRDRQQRCDENLPVGRWPANVILDEAAARLLDKQIGATSTTGVRSPRSRARRVPGTTWLNANHQSVEYPTDSGGASRFFFTAKASRADRESGLKRFRRKTARGVNDHPTVKPIALMRWLCRLVTPITVDIPSGRAPGVVFDPFCGSGSTGVAARAEGFRFIGIDQDAETCKIARLRIVNDLAAVSDDELPDGVEWHPQRTIFDIALPRQKK